MHWLFLFLSLTSPYDTLIESEWRKAHVQPAPPVDDAGFLRRVYLDLAGELPPAEVVRAFLDERAPDKRARLVDALLASSRYPEHFTDYWTHVLLGRNARPGQVDELALRDWLRGELAKNAHWDQMARQLIAATGRNSDGGPRNPAQREKIQKIMQQLDDVLPSPSPAMVPLNGAVNYVLRYAQQPEDLAGHYAKTFLGVQIQCAQCHDHPTEKWKQDDFKKLTAAFARIRGRPLDDVKAGVRRLDVEDLPLPKKNKNPAAALDGTPIADRGALADWTVKSHWFARAIVNRYWTYFLGSSIDVPALLDKLAADFTKHEYDLAWLIRTICMTRVYQLSAAGRDGRYWADYRLRPLEPEELLAALSGATGIKLQDPKLKQLFNFLFAVDEDSTTDVFSGTLPQALFALNGELVNSAIGAKKPTLSNVLALPLSDEQRIAALYLRTLSRPPSASELKHWIPFVQKGSGAWEDLFWALLNSSEFTFHH
jgi:hypothetical protein